jgi:hypothetical protein
LRGAVNRPEFLALLAAASGARTPSGISAEISIQRDSDALLAPFTVAIALRNSTRTIVGLDFPTADLFRIDVRSDDHILWSSASGHSPLHIARRVDVPPGLFRLVSEIVDATTDDRRSLAPGTYTIRVALLGTDLRTTIDRRITFAPPFTVASALAAKPGVVFTTAGIQVLGPTGARLTDPTGTIALSHPLGAHPVGTFIVRGSLERLGTDAVQLVVDRFAPAFENLIEARPTVPVR